MLAIFAGCGGAGWSVVGGTLFPNGYTGHWARPGRGEGLGDSLSSSSQKPISMVYGPFSIITILSQMLHVSFVVVLLMFSVIFAASNGGKLTQ